MLFAPWGCIDRTGSKVVCLHTPDLKPHNLYISLILMILIPTNCVNLLRTKGYTNYWVCTKRENNQTHISVIHVSGYKHNLVKINI